MKNIHLIPTDKASKLGLHKNSELELHSISLTKNLPYFSPQNSYITNDEEIKEGDYYLYCNQVNKRIGKNPKAEYPYPNYQKIILTDNKDLIKDGVQAIDDNFLEWFVNNPSCEKVETKLIKDSEDHPELAGNPKEEWFYYEIIIPKEEPKQENCCTPIGQIKRYKDCVGCDKKPKQENTLEEAAIDSKKRYINETAKTISYREFIEGAKWQQERSYSEVIDLFITEIKDEFKDDNWDYLEFIKERVLEQFKKK
jgi:hypothetical protein